MSFSPSANPTIQPPPEQPRPSPQEPAISLGPLQPLPRGRPPWPKQSGPPPESWRPDNSQEWEQYANASPDSQQQQQQPQSRRSRKPAVDLAYTRGGHLLDGYNAARYPGISNTHASFSIEGKVLHLTGPNNIHAWIEQVTYIARALSCHDELTKRFTSFPNPSSVQLFICETRHATAFRVLEAFVSGPVWAYMRVLGYSSVDAGDGLMSPAPVDCFEYAKLAASRMLIAGTQKQPDEERKRMVQEILHAESTDYPSERSYKKGLDWLRLACDNLIKQGDYKLAVDLYDPVPDWAPKPGGAGQVEPATSTAIPGEFIAADSLERNEAGTTLGASGPVAPADEIVMSPEADGPNGTTGTQPTLSLANLLEQGNDSPTATEVAGIPAMSHTPASPSLTSEDANTQSTKRKRSNDDAGPGRERPQPGVTTEP